MWGVIALTVATFTVLLAVRRFLVVGSGLLFSRYVAVGGLVAFSTDREGGGVYHVRFEVGGPAVFHNVAVQVFSVPEATEAAELQRPALRHTMAAVRAVAAHLVEYQRRSVGPGHQPAADGLSRPPG